VHITGASTCSGSLRAVGCWQIWPSWIYFLCSCNIHVMPFPKFSAAEGATTASTCADCGDGIIQAGDKCDDGNTASKDGCSPSCKIEEGASCWRIGTPPMEKTECCAPCDAGSYRQGCTYMSADVANGICALCPVNTYKPAR